MITALIGHDLGWRILAAALLWALVYGIRGVIRT